MVVLGDSGKESDGGPAAHREDHEEGVGDGSPAEEGRFDFLPDAGEGLFQSTFGFNVCGAIRRGERGERWDSDECCGDPTESDDGEFFCTRGQNEDAERSEAERATLVEAACSAARDFAAEGAHNSTAA